MGRDFLSSRIEKKLAVFTGIGKERCMYKVHELLRDVNQKAYKPMLLAIGPYHHDKVSHGFMEDHKLLYLQQMLERTEGSVQEYITALREVEETARNCYVECISQTSDQFVEIMLLDGCFIIELFHKFEICSIEGYCPDDSIFQMKWVLGCIARDLLLFENQLPFFVLAKLLGISESSENLGKHVVDIEEEKDGVINVESSTPTVQMIRTRLSDLALCFFSGLLPFKWNVDASSYNSPEKIKDLLCLAHDALTPSFSDMVCRRLKVGFRFKNAEFEHLLGLIHTTICISLLDTEIANAREHQEPGAKFKIAEIFKRLFGLIRKADISMAERDLNGRKVIQDWKSIPFGSELRKARVELNTAYKFKVKVDELHKWITIPFAVKLQEAGIELNKASKFKETFDPNRSEDGKSGLCEWNAIQKFKRLLCLDKIETWKSIPYGKVLQKAGVEFHKAKKFKRLLALDDWNIPCATELKEAGIKFKMAEKSNSFSIKFNNGLLEISPLKLEDYTETYLRNLIAYEQYCHPQNGSDYVYNYVRFMDHLINTPKDVELVRRKGIISNCLGGDDIISDMVNKLGHYITFSANIYATTSTNLNMYCKRRCNKRMAKLRRDYFNSPWALISFLAAVFLLGLAITQTIFSIIH